MTFSVSNFFLSIIHQKKYVADPFMKEFKSKRIIWYATNVSVFPLNKRQYLRELIAVPHGTMIQSLGSTVIVCFVIVYVGIDKKVFL